MNYRFNFKKYPNLLELYEVYRKLKLKATGYSMHDSESANRKRIKINEKNSEYAYTILARAIYDTFAQIKPMLHNADRDIHLQWDEVFDKPFEKLDINHRKCLVGLLDGNFVYELPLNYYND